MSIRKMLLEYTPLYDDLIGIIGNYYFPSKEQWKKTMEKVFKEIKEEIKQEKNWYSKFDHIIPFYRFILRRNAFKGNNSYLKIKRTHYLLNNQFEDGLIYQNIKGMLQLARYKQKKRFMIHNELFKERMGTIFYHHLKYKINKELIFCN